MEKYEASGASKKEAPGPLFFGENGQESKNLHLPFYECARSLQPDFDEPFYPSRNCRKLFPEKGEGLPF
jgi:hypothetical protein